VAAELTAVMERRRGGGALVCSPLVRPGAGGPASGADGFALGPAVAATTAGQAVIALALGTSGAPSPLSMMVW
jgi:hypothetical protein